MKKKIIITLSIILILIIGLTCLEITNAKSIKDKTLDYLETLSYTEDMIESIKVSYYPINKILGYNDWKIETVFKDLPDITFWLTYKEKQILFQGVTGTPLLTKEETIEYMDEFKTSSLFREAKTNETIDEKVKEVIENLEKDEAIHLPNSAFRYEEDTNYVRENIDDTPEAKEEKSISNKNEDIKITYPDDNPVEIVHDPKKEDSENKIVTNNVTLTWNDERTIFTAYVKGNPTTGYMWKVKSNGKWAVCDEGEYISDAKPVSDPKFQLVGAGGTYTFTIKIDENKLIKNDTNIVTLDYLRPWEGEAIDSISISFTSHDDMKVYCDILK